MDDLKEIVMEFQEQRKVLNSVLKEHDVEPRIGDVCNERLEQRLVSNLINSLKVEKGLKKYAEGNLDDEAFVKRNLLEKRLRTELAQSAARLARREKAVAKNPKSVNAHYSLAIEYEEEGMPDKAMMEYKKILKLDPKNGGAHNNIGNIYQTHGKIGAAVREYKKMLKNQGDRDLGCFQISRIHNSLGQKHKGAGQLEKASVEFKKAVKSDPKDIYPHENLAEVYSIQGRPKDALKEYNMVLKLRPKRRGITKKIREIQTEMEDLKKLKPLEKGV